MTTTPKAKIKEITIREHFAGLAMLGFVSSPNRLNGSHEITIEKIAEVSVLMADALIAELNREK